MTLKQQKNGVILVVDDQANNLKVISSVLNKDYNLSAAPSGIFALKILEKLEPDLILLDVMMPKMNGFEVCKKIKENSKSKDIPIIFLTAKTEIEDIINGFNLGAVDFISKPFIPKEILTKIENHLICSRAKKIVSDKNLQLEHLTRELLDLKEKLDHANKKILKFEQKIK